MRKSTSSSKRRTRSKPKLGIVQVVLDVWESHILVFWDCSVKEASKYLDKNFTGVSEQTRNVFRDCSENCGGFCLGDQPKSGNSIIWIPKGHSPERWSAVLAHEAVHAVSNVMEHWGIVKNKDTEEVLTSSVGRIVQKVLEAKHAKTRKKK